MFYKLVKKFYVFGANIVALGELDKCSDKM